jgi:Phage portal protein
VSLWDRLAPRVPDVRWMEQLQPQIEAWVDRSNLQQVMLGDLGVSPGDFPLTRAGAMRVPAMARARNLTCGTIAALPLEAMRGADPVTPQPYWAYGTDGQLGGLTVEQRRAWCVTPQTPFHRMLWTVDDLLFHGESLWLATARYASPSPFPSRMVRVPYDHWELDTEGRIVDLDAQPFPEEDVVWIPGPNEGVLGFGAASLRMAYDLERNAADVAMRPLRLELHQTSAAEMTPEERREAVGEVRTAMASNDGVLFTNNALQLIEHRVDSDALQLGARNNSALDVARLANMPAMMLDATAQGASLEYQTMAGRNQQWLDYGLALYMDAIEARLSMDDIVPAGQRVPFDTTDWTAPDASPTGPPLED